MLLTEKILLLNSENPLNLDTLVNSLYIKSTYSYTPVCCSVFGTEWFLTLPDATNPQTRPIKMIQQRLQTAIRREHFNHTPSSGYLTDCSHVKQIDF